MRREARPENPSATPSTYDTTCSATCDIGHAPSTALVTIARGPRTTSTRTRTGQYVLSDVTTSRDTGPDPPQYTARFDDHLPRGDPCKPTCDTACNEALRHACSPTSARVEKSEHQAFNGNPHMQTTTRASLNQRALRSQSASAAPSVSERCTGAASAHPTLTHHSPCTRVATSPLTPTPGEGCTRPARIGRTRRGP